VCGVFIPGTIRENARKQHKEILCVTKALSKNNMAGGMLGTTLFSVPLKAWGLKRIPP
jgi:hypothetical protein